MNSNIVSPFELSPEKLGRALDQFETEWENNGVVIFYSWDILNKLPPKESYFSQNEFEEYGLITSESRKEQFLVSRWMIKALLGALFKTNPKYLNLFKSENGKPLLVSKSSENLKELQKSELSLESLNTPFGDFNLSHKSGFSLVGFTKSGKIGVDVEQNTSDKKTLAIAERYFHPLEIEWMKEATNEEELKFRFYRLWCMKEAVIKTLGGSVFQNINDFYLSPWGQQFKMVSQTSPWSLSSQWKLFELKLPKDYIGAFSLFKE